MMLMALIQSMPAKNESKQTNTEQTNNQQPIQCSKNKDTANKRTHIQKIISLFFLYFIIQLVTSLAGPTPGQDSSIVLPPHVSKYCESQLARPAINPPNLPAYYVSFATQSSETLPPAAQPRKTIIRPDTMTQIDPDATIPRLAGGFEMTYPAGRLIYLPSLHVTSGEVNLELSTSTLTSLAKPLPGWVHTSQVIKMQMYTLILLSIVIQSATSSYGIDHCPGDPGSHIIAYPTAGIETPTLMQCSAKPPDSSYQPVRQVTLTPQHYNPCNIRLSITYVPHHYLDTLPPK